MQLDLILETMHRVPNSSFLLILVLATASAFLVNHILKAGPFTTAACIPVLHTAGLLGYAILTVNGIFLLPDKASNTALSATFGFILLASISFLLFRAWTRLNDKR